MNEINAAIIEAMLRHGKSVRVTLKGRCMEPLLSEGDIAWIQAAGSCEKGNLCLVRLQSGEVAVHRLIEKIDTRLITKGDYSGRAEEISAQDVLGIVRAVCFHESTSIVDYSPGVVCRVITCFLSKAIGFSRIRFVRHISRKLIWEFNSLQRKYLLKQEC